VGNIEVPLDLLRELKRRWPDCVLGNLLMEPFPVGNSLLRSAVPLYDCIFTFSKFQVAQLYWFQAQKVVWLPFGMAPAVHHRVAPTAAEQARFGSAVAYMGTWQPHVELWLEPLAGQDLKIWGNQWYRSAGHAQLVSKWQGEGAGLYQDMAKIVGASRVIFNMVRFHNGNGHSMKTFEIPACGGFMLTNRTDEQLEFFAEDEGAAYYSTTAELLDKLKFYLGHDTARSRIAERGHQLAQQHSYAARARQILDVQCTIISR
jgi:spore maturation protein CgeB